MVLPTLPVSPTVAVTVSDLRSLRQLAESGQLKTWQAGAILDVVVNRQDGGLLLLASKQGPISLPVPADRQFPPGTALQLQVLALAPLQVQLRPAVPANQPAAATTSSALPLPVASSGSPAPAGLTPSLASPGTTANATSHISVIGQHPTIQMLHEQLQTLLRPAGTAAVAGHQTPLLRELEQWLARINTWQSAAEPDAPDPHPASVLVRQLLQAWPQAQHSSEPDELETLLRQALFGHSPRPDAANAARPATTDWLGALLKLLQATPTTLLPPQMQPPTPPPATGPLQTKLPDTAHGGKDALPTSTAFPLPAEDLLDELASLLGRQQQQWLNNLQQDLRQQPLYAELLLRQQERLDRIEISVRADRDADAETNAGGPHHVVRLRFDLPGLGVCQFLLDLNRDDLQLHFYSEDASAAAAFDQHLDWLARQLATDGVQLSTAHSHTVAQLPSLQPTQERGLHVQV